MFGIVRAYKGLDLLLRGLSLSRNVSVKLSVVGEIWQDAGDIRQLVLDLGLQHKVELVARYVTDADAAEYFARADVVVLPYRSVTGSGVLPLAFYYGRPVVASRLPGFSELVRPGETGWLVPADSAEAWAEAIDHTLSATAARDMRPHVEAMQKQWSFAPFAERVLRVGLGDSAEI